MNTIRGWMTPGLLFLILLCAGCAGLATAPVTAEQGDIVVVRYVASTEEGRLVATNRQDVAGDRTGSWLPGFGPADVFSPEAVIAGEKGPLTGVEREVLGMSAGDARRVTLPAQEAYGVYDPALVKQIPARIESPLHLELPISEFVGRYDRFPALEDAFPYNTYLAGKVSEVREETITVDLSPRGERFDEPFGTVSLETTTDGIVSTLAARVGSPFSREGRTGLVIATGAESFTVDFNHPLAEKPLVVDLQVEDVIRRSSLPVGEPDWIRDEAAALGRSATSGKPLVLVLHSPGCGNCEVFFATTMNDPIVRALRGRFEWASVEAKSKPELERKYQIESYPTILLMSPEGREMARVDGSLDAQAFWRLVMGTGRTWGTIGE